MIGLSAALDTKFASGEISLTPRLFTISIVGKVSVAGSTISGVALRLAPGAPAILVPGEVGTSPRNSGLRTSSLGLSVALRTTEASIPAPTPMRSIVVSAANCSALSKTLSPLVNASLIGSSIFFLASLNTSSALLA